MAAKPHILIAGAAIGELTACARPPDGVILARCLDEYDDVATALTHYQKARVGRATKIVVGSTEAGKRFHNPILADSAAALGYMEASGHPRKFVCAMTGCSNMMQPRLRFDCRRIASGRLYLLLSSRFHN